MGETMDRAKSKAKQIAGKLTGNKIREAKGVAEQLRGNLEGVVHKAEGVVHKAEVAVKNVVDSVKSALGTKGHRARRLARAVTTKRSTARKAPGRARAG